MKGHRLAVIGHTEEMVIMEQFVNPRTIDERMDHMAM
jgi:hypothetical protein